MMLENVGQPILVDVALEIEVLVMVKAGTTEFGSSSPAVVERHFEPLL